MTKSNTEKPKYSPSETWSVHEQDLDEAIVLARRELNQQDPKELIAKLQSQVQHSSNGVSYAILKGDQPAEYSDSEALVMFNPFANASTPNMLVRAEFLREVAKFTDVRDENGNLKPVVMLASPGLGGSKLKFNAEDRISIKSGDLGPAAKELLRAVSEAEIGKVALLGYSQGADVALAGARSAYSANLDTEAVSIGEPAGVEDRGVVKLGIDFFKTPSLKPSIERTGLDAQKESVGRGRYEGSRFIYSILTRPINWSIIRGMSSDSFERNAQRLLDEDSIEKLVVGYGSESSVSKPEILEPTLSRLGNSDKLISVKVMGGNHTWGDQMTLLAKLYMKALS